MKKRRVKFDIRQHGRPILIVLVAMLALNAVLYLAFVRPKIREYRDLVEGSQPQREALTARIEAVEEKEAYLGALEQAAVDLVTLRTEVLSTRNARMVEVEQELADICAQFGINLDLVTFGGEALVNERLDRLDMLVPLEGGYGSLRRFLHAVEESDRFLLVERVAIVEGKEGGVMLQLNITLTTYFDLPDVRRRARSEAVGSARPGSA